MPPLARIPSARIPCVRGFDEYGCQSGFMSVPEVTQLVGLTFIPATSPLFLHEYRGKGGALSVTGVALRWESFQNAVEACDTVRNSDLAYVGVLLKSPFATVTKPWQLLWASLPSGSEEVIGSLVQPRTMTDWLFRTDPTKPFDPTTISPGPGATAPRTFKALPLVSVTPPSRKSLHYYDLTNERFTAPSAVDDRFPHACPRCGGRAYVGLATVDCARDCAGSR